MVKEVNRKIESLVARWIEKQQFNSLEDGGE